MLFPFLTTLFTQGEVTVAAELKAFGREDLAKAARLLEQIHAKDALDLPYQAPVFAQAAAIWGAQYLYRSIQCSLRRDLEEAQIQKTLLPFAGVFSPSNIYSIDLTLRYLPDLFNLAKGLSPDDFLVTDLKKTATLFPFSSVGIEIGEAAEHAPIFENAALKQAYLDRIIQKKDRKRVEQFHFEEHLQTILGDYATVFWPS